MPLSAIVVAAFMLLGCLAIGAMLGWFLGNKLYPDKTVEVETTIVFDSDEDLDIPSNKYVDYSNKNNL